MVFYQYVTLFGRLLFGLLSRCFYKKSREDKISSLCLKFIKNWLIHNCSVGFSRIVHDQLKGISFLPERCNR